MPDIDETALIEAAKAVRKNAYAPFSGYYVGSAVLDENGNVHIGCNVENSSYPEGSCAEANAIAAMIGAGGKKIVAISAVGGNKSELQFCTPCGGCRQRISEFADENTRVLLANADATIENLSIDYLLPASFKL